MAGVGVLVSRLNFRLGIGAGTGNRLCIAREEDGGDRRREERNWPLDEGPRRNTASLFETS